MNIRFLNQQTHAVTIRPYTSANRNACIEIFKSNIPKYFAVEELSDFEYWLNALEENTIAKHDEEHYFVLEKDGNVIACAGVFVTDNNMAGLAWGMVHRQHHKTGIGKDFLAFRINYLKNNYPAINKIVVDTSQHTFSFFEKYGFVVQEITLNGYAEGLDRYDMMLEL